jgi:nucleotide-binding universal stress UspA family protein
VVLGVLNGRLVALQVLNPIGFGFVLEDLGCVDGSPDAKKALDYAISLAKTYGSILTVMYVVHRRVYVAAEEACFAPTAALIQGMEEQGKKILDEAKGTAQSRGVELDTVVVHGISTEEILKAEADKYDMIVVGSRGRTAAKAFLLGSLRPAVDAGKVISPTLPGHYTPMTEAAWKPIGVQFTSIQASEAIRFTKPTASCLRSQPRRQEIHANRTAAGRPRMKTMLSQTFYPSYSDSLREVQLWTNLFS